MTFVSISNYGSQQWLSTLVCILSSSSTCNSEHCTSFWLQVLGQYFNRPLIIYKQTQDSLLETTDGTRSWYGGSSNNYLHISTVIISWYALCFEHSHLDYLAPSWMVRRIQPQRVKVVGGQVPSQVQRALWHCHSVPARRTCHIHIRMCGTLILFPFSFSKKKLWFGSEWVRFSLKKLCLVRIL